MLHTRNFSLQTIKAKLAFVAFLTIFADWLFYQQPLGCNVALFAAVGLGAACLFNPSALRSKSAKIVFACLLPLIVVMTYSPRWLPVMTFTVGVVTLLMMKKHAAFPDGIVWLENLASFLRRIMKGWRKDYSQIRTVRHNRTFIKGRFLLLLTYTIIPFIFTVLFCWLFAKANPILAGFFRKISWDDFAALFTLRRISFWLICLITLWAFLRPRFATQPVIAFKTRQMDVGRLVTVGSIIVSLVLFNLLFAMQNIMDISFLWGEHDLPQGMSYATYARSGAYPLIVTVLMAAAYVLIIFGDNHAYHTPVTSKLALVWIGQNIFLTMSAVYRTMLYIDAYSLTHLRIAGLLWMFLISAGLIFVIAKIQLKKSNSWLVNCNMLATALLIYGCCFVNFNAVIADYNVNKYMSQSDDNARMDLSYVASLNFDALQALRTIPLPKNDPVIPQAVAEKEALRAHLLGLPSAQSEIEIVESYHKSEIKMLRAHLENQLNIRASFYNWRAWTWQQQILLESRPATSATQSLDKNDQKSDK